MDLRQQVLQFRSRLEERGLTVDDFELNVDGDTFRDLLAGGTGRLEVLCRGTGIAITYAYDGTPAWLAQLTTDLDHGAFANPG